MGLGCIHPGDVALITGSSHLHLCVCDNPSPDMKGVGHAGCWGVYRAAPVTNIAFAEGGQSSTGSVMSWLKNSIMSTSRADGAYGPSRHGTEYRDLDAEAAQLPIGAEGLVALETFQGARTPLTNACQRGAIVGLSLAHTRGHVWRAFLEAVCYGTKACLDALEEATNTEGVDQDLNYSHSAVAIAGGVTRSPMWLQMHADVMQRPVVVGECENAPLLGCAILAAAALKYQSEGKVDEDSQMRELSPMNLSLANHIEACVRQMVRQGKYVLPSAENANAYNRTYEVYCKLAPALEEIFHSMS